jgi:hypothetical protein
MVAMATKITEIPIFFPFLKVKEKKSKVQDES